MDEAAYFVGQLVHHKLFDYRGVIYDVDPHYGGSEDWYERVAKTRPPKEKPWYRILVHGRQIETYVAERNLEPDPASEPIDHPMIEQLFQEFSDGTYQPRLQRN